MLLQKVQDVWRPVAYALRSLTPVEERYAQIEKEALAFAWACSRFEDYLMGPRFSLETDHKPLVALLGSKPLADLSPRIQRIMRMMRYDYEIYHTAGKELHTADTLSRAPVASPSSQDSEILREIDQHVNLVMASLPASV